MEKNTIGERPSLIPLPQTLEWTQDKFPLDRSRAIIINDTSLQKEANRLLAMTGRNIPIEHKIGEDSEYTIQLKLALVTTPVGEDEAYHLTVKKEGVVLTANTPHGIFNGLQTFYQLIDRNMVQGCKITDYPAYQWRGYMADVGRNYQSVGQLKQQIDIMSRYKLNIFHFHLTENTAWRLQVKQYPQLTAPENMFRNKGQYYSISDMKELIQYCRTRHIILVPEIDMPGHSAAFSRAMGVDMQSDKGLKIIKNIVREICMTYNIPYIHIGADEVAIRNKQFLPEVIRLIHQYKKQAIVWAPGGNYGDNTIHQLWKKDKKLEKTIKYIDSRNLYLSDMAPESSVVTIFERQIGTKTRGDSSLLGAEICLWDDRRVAKESDHLIMNAVYPDMLAFGERSWLGGGYPVGPDASKRANDFASFEKRLINHKQKYFTRLPFTYVRQIQLQWKLFGPFKNRGNLGASFWPESSGISLADSAAPVNARGGTIWLWHHGASSGSWLPSPKKNTSWYAFTRFWSDIDSTMNMWIEFKNLSRSGADATPPPGEWDYKKSKIWINGRAIPPPEWKYPGREVGKLEEPLVDEGYNYRPPTEVDVKKGWNHILVKLPLKIFKLQSWQRPPKWMFTVIPVYKGEGINWYAEKTDFQITNVSK